MIRHAYNKNKVSFNNTISVTGGGGGGGWGVGTHANFPELVHQLVSTQIVQSSFLHNLTTLSLDDLFPPTFGHSVSTDDMTIQPPTAMYKHIFDLDNKN